MCRGFDIIHFGISKGKKKKAISLFFSIKNASFFGI